MLIHIAIVSDQILANLIPALTDRPDKVYLVSSAKMTADGRDKRLKKQLARQGIDAEILTGAPDTGLDAIREYALQLEDDVRAQHPDAHVIFNSTGGTKLMSLGFTEMLRGLANRIIYTDTAHQNIAVLHDRDKPNAYDLPMKDVLDVPTYLYAQGFLYQADQSSDGAWLEQAASRKQACKYLARNASELGDFIGALNAWAASVLNDQDDALVGPPPTIRYPESPRRRAAWENALQEIAKSRLIEVNENQQVDFASAEGARFFKGGWLEEYAWHIVRDEHPHDVRLNVTGQWDGTPKARNEFDVLACHRNQLLFIECKTLRFDAEQKDSDLSYKTESLGKDTRGLYGQTWLLSARKPSEVLQDRSRQAGFKLIGPDELPKLRDRVRAWMEGQQ